MNHNIHSWNDGASCVILEYNISRSWSLLDRGDVAIILINGYVDNMDGAIVGFIYCCSDEMS